jgi:plasmid stabilization system protein ParE
MTVPIVFLDEARAEFDAAADWYDSQRPGLGTRFIRQVEEVPSSIAATPRMHQVIYQDIRRAVVKKFPYTVLYRVGSDHILVVAVFHGKRDPAVWRGRV